MPRTGYIIAIAVAIVSSVIFAGGAGATHPPGGQIPAGEEPYWTCSASVARATLLNGEPIPPIDPLAANSERAECAEDQGGLPDIALPPPPDAPVVKTTTAQSRTQIFCAGDPVDPKNPPQDDPATPQDETEACDAGVPSYEQQVLSTANVTKTTITLGALEIIVDAANTSASARCGDGNVPVLSSTSKVADIQINGTPVPLDVIITGEPNQVIDVSPLVKITLNELTGAEGAYADNDTEGFVTRRAVHIEVLPGVGTTPESVADIVVSESTADFHGDVCPEGKIVIEKQTAPDEDPNSTDFGFTSPGLTPASFNLRDDGRQPFDEVQPGTYTVTENAPSSPYTLAVIDCLDREDNSTSNVGTRTASINVSPGETVSCTFTNVRPGPPPPGQVTCPPNSVPNERGQCIINRADCPPGTGRNPQGQCVISNVKCPDGTIFDVTTFACIEKPQGGTLFPLTQQIRNLFPGSPCIGSGFGPLFVVLGTNGPDRITGTNRSDRIFALGGNDRVSGGRGDDCIEGGSGNDVLDGSNGNDFLLGGTGNDQVSGGPGRDRFSGGSGRDVMSGGTGADVMRGGGGRDRLNGGYGNDRLFGGSGNDGIHTGNGRDRVFAGSGNDVINAATRGPAAFVDCGPGKKDRVRINRNEIRRIRNCEFVDVPRRIRSENRAITPR